MVRIFEFSIVVDGVNPQTNDFETAFYEAGCDDALVCVQNSVVFLDFSREAKTFDQAVDSAIADIKTAGAIPTQVWQS